MTCSVVVSVLLLGLLSDGQGRPQSADAVPIFVGPQVRDGFVDVDRGVIDSIEDIRNELRRTKPFRIVQTPTDARIVLLVVGRRIAGQVATVGVPIGTMNMFLPVHRRAIDTLLRVGSYERAITSEDENSDQWKAAAKQVARDVTAWLNANRGALLHAKPEAPPNRQASSEEVVCHTDADVTCPHVLRRIEPQYTSDAMRAKVQGTALVECVVNKDGSVSDVQIVRSLDPVFGLDQEAIKAAKQWRFQPGTRMGEPVSVAVTIELTFKLR